MEPPTSRWPIIPGKPGSVQNPKLFHLPPTAEQLEKFWLLCLFVVSKKAKIQQGKLQQFLDCLAIHFGDTWAGCGPLEALATMPLGQRTQLIHDSLVAVKAGQYTRLTSAIVATTKMVPLLHAIDEGWPDGIQPGRRNMLASIIPGAGMKTASFFCLYGHGLPCAVLDTHIIQYMKDKGRLSPQFNLTPASYRQAELIFLDMCDEQSRQPWDMDFAIWADRSSSSDI